MNRKEIVAILSLRLKRVRCFIRFLAVSIRTDLLSRCDPK